MLPLGEVKIKGRLNGLTLTGSRVSKKSRLYLDLLGGSSLDDRIGISSLSGASARAAAVY